MLFVNNLIEETPLQIKKRITKKEPKYSYEDYDEEHFCEGDDDGIQLFLLLILTINSYYNYYY